MNSNLFASSTSNDTQLVTEKSLKKPLDFESQALPIPPAQKYPFTTTPQTQVDKLDNTTDTDIVGITDVNDSTPANVPQ